MTVTNEPQGRRSETGSGRRVGGSSGDPPATAVAAARTPGPTGGPSGASPGGSAAPSVSAARVEEFRREIAAMKVRDPATQRDRLWGRIGIGLMFGGLALALGSYFLSHNTTNPLQQRDALVSAIGGLAACVVGAALFLRASLAGFLRFWLARLSYEAQAQTDRLIEHLDR